MDIVGEASVVDDIQFTGAWLDYKYTYKYPSRDIHVISDHFLDPPSKSIFNIL